MLAILSKSFATKGNRDVGWMLEGEMRSREGLFFLIFSGDITVYLHADGKDQ